MTVTSGVVRGQPPAPADLSDRIWPPGWTVSPESLSAAPGESNSLSDGAGVFIPIRIGSRPIRIDRILLEVTTAGAGSAIRLAAYSVGRQSRLPEQLIIDAGQVDSSATGVKAITVDAVLPAGLVALMAVMQGGTSPKVRASEMLVSMDKSLGTSTSTYSRGWVNAAVGTGSAPGQLGPEAFSSSAGSGAWGLRIMLRVAP